MQKIGQIASGILPILSSGTENIALKQGRNSPIRTGGLKTEDGRKITAIARSRKNGISDQQQVARLLHRKHLLSLWQIKADDLSKNEAVDVLKNLLTPATYEEAAKEIARWLMHYPRRHVEQDAVIIQDLASDLEKFEIGIGVVIESLAEVRREYRVFKSGEENPWPPQTAYVLKKASEKQRDFEYLLNKFEPKPLAVEDKTLREKAAETEKMPWDGMAFADMPDDVRMELWRFCERLPSQMVSVMYCNSYNIAYLELVEWFRQLK